MKKKNLKTKLIMMPALVATIGLIYAEFVIGMFKELKKQHTHNTTD